MVAALGVWGPKRLVGRSIKRSILTVGLSLSFMRHEPGLLAHLGRGLVVPGVGKAFFCEKIVHHCLPVVVYYEYKIIYMPFCILLTVVREGNNNHTLILLCDLWFK